MMSLMKMKMMMMLMIMKKMMMIKMMMMLKMMIKMMFKMMMMMMMKKNKIGSKLPEMARKLIENIFLNDKQKIPFMSELYKGKKRKIKPTSSSTYDDDDLDYVEDVDDDYDILSI